MEFSFVSKVRANLPSAVFLRLARQIWSFNNRTGLTGELRLQGGSFVQVVEGPCDIVQPLAARILADPRHGSIRIGAFRELAARRYLTWTSHGFEADGLPSQIPFVQPANLHFIPSRRRAGAAVLGVPS